MLDSGESRHVQRLAKALSEIPIPISCAGSFLPKKPVSVRLKGRPAVQIAFSRTSDLKEQAKAIAPLLARCATASFGKGSKTLRDETVRRAMNLRAEGGAFAVENFDPAKSGILDEVVEKLRPGATNSLSAQLYDVNVYEEGGHFSSHKDTPRGKNDVGTLVIILPMRFTGGALTLRHDGRRITRDLSAAVQEQAEAHRIHWVAFFGDVDHSVERVNSGHRVTLTYRLMAKRSTQKPNETMLFANLLRSEFERLLSDRRAFREGIRLLFPCFHLYGSQAFPRAGRLTKSGLNRLKGRDRVLSATAWALGLRAWVRPFLLMSDDDSNQTWRLERFLTHRDVSSLVRASDEGEGVTEDSITSTLPLNPHDEPSVWVVPPRTMLDQSATVEVFGDLDSEAHEDEDGESDEPGDEINEEYGTGDESHDTDEDEAENGDIDSEVPAKADQRPLNELVKEPLGGRKRTIGHFLETLYSSTGYLGNEASLANFYVFAVLEVEIPAR